MNPMLLYFWCGMYGMVVPFTECDLFFSKECYLLRKLHKRASVIPVN